MISVPEIAEVETVRRILKKQILNKEIADVKVLYSTMVESDLNEFKKELVGKTFNDILRKGKWLIFDLDGYYLISHLRMEGKFFIKPASDKVQVHEHVIFTFNDNSTLRYHDTRKFGRMKLVKKEEMKNCIEIQKQGYEPGDKNLTGDYLLQKFKGKRIPMKTMLLDQTIISGLGNIYVDEVLFRCNINPLKKPNDITLDEANNICKASDEIIKKAIECGGTTIRSYTSSLGVEGSYQKYLQVHRREGLKCNKCNSIIKRIVVNGRSTYYCPKSKQ